MGLEGNEFDSELWRERLADRDEGQPSGTDAHNDGGPPPQFDRMTRRHALRTEARREESQGCRMRQPNWGIVFFPSRGYPALRR